MKKILIFLVAIFTGLFFSAGSALAQGCDDSACEVTVCNIDPFCCTFAWDGLCQFEADDVCAACNEGVCPKGDGWNLTTTSAVLDIDVGNTHDQNEDGYVCVKAPKGFARSGDNGQSPIAWVVKDNSKPHDEESNCCTPEEI